MGLEIERKFLVDTSKLDLGNSVEVRQIKQGYIHADKEKSVRVRLDGEIGIITVKRSVNNTTREEYEYEIGYKPAINMLYDVCDQIIRKQRYVFKHGTNEWEVDVFEGDNGGLIVAEIELSSEDEDVDLPDWVTEEVTNDMRYLNPNLSTNPYNTWQ